MPPGIEWCRAALSPPARAELPSCRRDSSYDGYLIAMLFYSHACISVELFASNKASSFTTPQIGDWCWHWIGANDVGFISIWKKNGIMKIITMICYCTSDYVHCGGQEQPLSQWSEVLPLFDCFWNIGRLVIFPSEQFTWIFKRQVQSCSLFNPWHRYKNVNINIL